MVSWQLTSMVIILSVWTALGVFVVERRWKVALVIIVFAPAVQEPGSGFGFGWVALACYFGFFRHGGRVDYLVL